MIGKVLGIFIAPKARMPMVEVREVMALTGQGLLGDRYFLGEGSYNRGSPGKRQVSLINAKFFHGTGFTFIESRRNLVIEGTELMYLIDREFQAGDALMRGVKYCEPCEVPRNLLGKNSSFKEAFHDVGGILAEVIEEGLIWKNCSLIPPSKNY